jgi:hypothetical protein
MTVGMCTVRPVRLWRIQNKAAPLTFDHFQMANNVLTEIDDAVPRLTWLETCA